MASGMEIKLAVQIMLAILIKENVLTPDQAYRNLRKLNNKGDVPLPDTVEGVLRMLDSEIIT